MKPFCLVHLLILSLFLAHNADAEGLKVVASIYPLGDIVKQVGGERIDVKVMLPPAASAHTYEPTPKQILGLQDAKVFIKAGAGLEFWADRFVKTGSNKNMIVLDLSTDMPLIYGIERHDHDHRYKHEGDAADPHFWLDPVLAKKIVDRIANVLTKIDAGNKIFYSVNAEAYKKELDKLHEDITLKVKLFRTKEYVTFHSAWNYFSKRYGLKVVGVIEESPGREPSPRHTARLIKELKRLNSRVVFAEPQLNPKIAEVIAREAGAKVAFLDPIGGPNFKGRDTYIGLMRYNLSVMEGVMK
ncbi:MAG: zinc ABC transporter substrate-binding protein [Nitrospirae bacterium]|nr:zinc ABC transporter substrate-binding protein [Nitrospirota bacterium]